MPRQHPVHCPPCAGWLWTCSAPQLVLAGDLQLRHRVHAGQLEQW